MKRRLVLTILAAALLLTGCGTRDLYSVESTTDTQMQPSVSSESLQAGTEAPVTTSPVENSAPQTALTTVPPAAGKDSAKQETEKNTTPPEQQSSKQTTKQTTVQTSAKPKQTTTATTTSTPVTTSRVSSDDKIAFRMKLTNNWPDGRKNVYQYEILLANYTNRDITEWTVKIPVEFDAKIVSSWGGKFSSISSSTLTITPDNAYPIPANGTLSMGFQIRLNDELTAIRQATLETGGLTVYSKNQIIMP